jgi:Tat protein translocase TatB subunit
MLNIGPQELLLILVIALIVVGPQRLPGLGRSIGRGLREIRKAQDEVKRTIQVNLDEQPSTDPQARPASSGERGPADPGSSATPPAQAGATGARVVPPAAEHEPAPLASEPPEPSEVVEISRALGRSLHELRRAREEVRRSFRVDLGESTPRGGTAPRAAPPSAPEPAAGTPPADDAPA